MEATLALEFGDEKISEAVAKAISPDNFKTPAGLDVKTFRDGKKVITQIKYYGKLATFTATIDDLLSSASTAEKAVKAIK